MNSSLNARSGSRQDFRLTTQSKLLTSSATSLFVTLIAFSILMPATSHAESVEAFTEPYLRIAVPASENGVIEQLLVKEGDEVSQGQLLGKLDDAVLRSSLELAMAARNATGSLKIAEADVEMKRQHMGSYLALKENGNATNRELARAEMELGQASARLLSVREELELRHLEYERVKNQIRKRQFDSPIKGVVISIEKEVGEFVSMTDPVVLHVVQLDALKAVFSVPRREAADLEKGQVVALEMGYENEPCEGVIEFVSPIANPESNTVRVKVRIANDEYQIPSGVTCRWSLSDESIEISSPTTQASRSDFYIPIAR